jgi:hypothetical protein
MRRVLYIDWGVRGVSGKDSSLSYLQFGAQLMVWLGILRIGCDGDKISLPLFDLRLPCEGRNLELGWGTPGTTRGQCGVKVKLATDGALWSDRVQSSGRVGLGAQG